LPPNLHRRPHLPMSAPNNSDPADCASISRLVETIFDIGSLPSVVFWTFINDPALRFLGYTSDVIIDAQQSRNGTALAAGRRSCAVLTSQ
jgi:hypothetical protein